MLGGEDEPSTAVGLHAVFRWSLQQSKADHVKLYHGLSCWGQPWMAAGVVNNSMLSEADNGSA